LAAAPPANVVNAERITTSLAGISSRKSWRKMKTVATNRPTRRAISARL